MILVKYKIFTALMFFIIACNYVYADVPEKIKVGLFYNNSALDSVRIGYDGIDLVIGSNDIVDEAVFVSDEGIIKVNEKRYRGSIILKRNDGGKLTVINEVDLEDYVASVVSKEMSPGFEMEALKVQAVCARTYAVANINKFAKFGFNVCDTVSSQVYGGIENEHERTVRAAQETKGEILTYQGNIANTVYFATSGGYTENVKYVWGSEFPYLVGVADEYESENVYAYRWTKEISPEQATSILEARGYDLGNILNIEVLEATPTGVVYKLKVTGDKGERTFTNEACRTLFGYNMLLSQAYTVTRNNGATIATHGGALRTSGLHILSADGISVHGGGDLHIKGANQTSVVTPVLSDNFIFNGRGNGHLVGMSQNGANAMAKAVFDYEKILKHYYTGTEILRRRTYIEHEGI